VIDAEEDKEVIGGVTGMGHGTHCTAELWSKMIIAWLPTLP